MRAGYTIRLRAQDDGLYVIVKKTFPHDVIVGVLSRIGNNTLYGVPNRRFVVAAKIDNQWHLAAIRSSMESASKEAAGVSREMHKDAVRSGRIPPGSSRDHESRGRHAYGGVRMCPCPGETRHAPMITFDPERDARRGRRKRRRGRR